MKKYDFLENIWKEPEELIEWGKNTTPPLQQPWLSYINFHCKYIDVMAVSRILFPEFVEYENGVFLDMNFTKEIYYKWKEKNISIGKMESIINHVHVYDLLQYDDNISEINAKNISWILQKTWSVSLINLFPNIKFDVRVLDTELDYGPCVTFSRKIHL